MALHWRPVGPEPEQTYWRRRAALAVALMLLIVLIAQLTGRVGDEDRLASGEPSPSSPTPGSAEPTPTTPSSASAPPSGAAADLCPPAELQIVADADKDSYPAGGRPQLELRVTNTGSAPCTLDLGQAATELLIFSGPDRIWSSDDCAPGGAAKPTTLEPGKAVPTRLTWAGRRSLPKCEGPKAQALPGTYRVTGRIGDLQAEGGSFQLTG
ncbi:MAG: DUF4232 domain-containing protein [Actinobacteria bacterium]|nr:DUF4232 domain-containing protein [Actinomycetota bacterium]MBW3648058.1 DUF4232 domain-containing protein [Actinomycetota bacterium]